MSISIRKIFLFLLLLSVPALVNTTAAEEAMKKQKTLINRKVDPRVYSRGQKLYLENCAVCHGKFAEGDANWRRPGKDGKYPPPPLNGTAHTWHHSPKALITVIQNGTGKIGGNMPAWKDRLTVKQISDILVWITSQWSDEIYTVWYNNFISKKSPKTE